MHQVLFPYARSRVADFIKQHRNSSAVGEVLDQVRTELAQPDASDSALVAALLQWIDQDRKITPLKTLQGMIWAEGYANGDFTAHVYADALDALRQWQRKGIPMHVYSSGSIAAQKQFFKHSVFGDLSSLFRHHFDTTIGAKRETASYQRIAEALAQPPNQIVFLSDIEAELDAAREAGMLTIQLLRADAPPESKGRHPVVAKMTDVDAKLATMVG